MVNAHDASDVIGVGRRRAWVAGGLVLLALGIGSLVVPLAGLLATGGRLGGLAFLPLAVPPIAAGYCVLRQIPWARVLGFTVALAYAVVVAYTATTPWRGLTPAQGQSPPPLDPGTVLVAVAFLISAALIAVGKPGSKAGGR